MGNAERLIDLYVLKDPVTGEVRYAGKANNAAKRLQSHLRDCKRRKTPVYCWMAKLVKAGRVPAMEVVERVSESAWRDAETALIARLRASGARMLNLADGGDQPSMTLEQRQANAKKMNERRAAAPAVKSRLSEMKRSLSSFVRTAPKTDRYYAIISKMRMAARMRPDLFGQWASL